MEATRIARANKRTITDMERLGTELKVITSQEVGVLTKGLLEESRKEEKELGKLASEANRYASESKVSTHTHPHRANAQYMYIPRYILTEHTYIFT